MSAFSRENPPLNGRYGPTLALVLLALCPDIVITTAYHFLAPSMALDLHTTAATLRTANGLSNAGYAFGAIFAGFLVQRFRQRRLFLVAEGLFVVAAGLAAVAPGVAAFAVGRILQGAATGLLLVIAIPPLTTRFPATRLPLTAAAIDIAFFGAVTVGPLVGGVLATEGWRWFFGGLAALGAVGWLLGMSSLPLQPAKDPQHRPDVMAFVFAALGTALPFYAVSQLGEHVSFGAPVFWAPMIIGLACLVALIATQYGRDDGLIPMTKLWHSVPLAGTLCAMIAGAAYVTLLLLDELFLQQGVGLSAQATGLAQWPGVTGLIVAALIFWRLFVTRFLPHFVLAGMILLLAAGLAVALLQIGSPLALSLGISAALGLGAGATVSPGLWLAGLSVKTQFLGRAFALVELVRSVADFLIAPTLQHVAMQHGQSGAALVSGVREAAWIMFGLTILGTLAMAALYLGCGARPQAPNIELWLSDGEPALHSPAVRLRCRR